MITTETLVTSPEAFGISKASACQLAACRVIDGRKLGKLRDYEDVVRFVGGGSALEALPSERGEQPLEVCFLASIRSLKTIISLATGVKATQTVDVSGLTHGEVPRVSIVGLKLDTSAAAFSVLLATVRSSPLLRELLVGEPTSDSLQLRHPSGRPVESRAWPAHGLAAAWLPAGPLVSSPTKHPE